MTTPLCECGCGLPAPISSQNNTKLGYIKGKPRRFRRGHYIKLNKIKVKRQYVSIDKRFWGKVKKTDSCWLWTGAKNGNGYGTIRYNGRPIGTHRMSWILANGLDIPKGMQVLHSCDNPLCVRPDHLSLGTLQENSKDMSRKGRASRKGPTLPRRGESNGSAVLNESDIRSIRSLYATGQHTMKQIANQYGVSDGAVRFIVRRITWKHVE